MRRILVAITFFLGIFLSLAPAQEPSMKGSYEEAIKNLKEKVARNQDMEEVTKTILKRESQQNIKEGEFREEWGQRGDKAAGRAYDAALNLLTDALDYRAEKTKKGKPPYGPKEMKKLRGHVHHLRNKIGAMKKYFRNEKFQKLFEPLENDLKSIADSLSTDKPGLDFGLDIFRNVMSVEGQLRNMLEFDEVMTAAAKAAASQGNDLEEDLRNLRWECAKIVKTLVVPVTKILLKRYGHAALRKYVSLGVFLIDYGEAAGEFTMACYFESKSARQMEERGRFMAIKRYELKSRVDYRLSLQKDLARLEAAKTDEERLHALEWFSAKHCNDLIRYGGPRKFNQDIWDLNKKLDDVRRQLLAKKEGAGADPLRLVMPLYEEHAHEQIQDVVEERRKAESQSTGEDSDWWSGMETCVRAMGRVVRTVAEMEKARPRRSRPRSSALEQLRFAAGVSQEAQYSRSPERMSAMASAAFDGRRRRGGKLVLERNDTRFFGLGPGKARETAVENPEFGLPKGVLLHVDAAQLRRALESGREEAGEDLLEQYAGKVTKAQCVKDLEDAGLWLSSEISALLEKRRESFRVDSLIAVSMRRLAKDLGEALTPIRARFPEKDQLERKAREVYVRTCASYRNGETGPTELAESRSKYEKVKKELCRAITDAKGWNGLPEKLRYPGRLGRICGYSITPGGEDILVLGTEAKGESAIRFDELVVAIEMVWERGLTPLCTLDPNGLDFSGDQIAKVDGVPHRSSFALVMLEADYLMKRIMFGDQLVEAPGYRSSADLLREAYNRDRRIETEASRFVFQPVEPAPGDIVVSPDGGLVRFSSRLRVLTEQLALGAQGLEATGKTTSLGAEEVRLFNEHLDTFAEQFPVLRRLQCLTDLYLLCRIWRELNVDAPFLRELAALPVPDVDVPRAYKALVVPVVEIEQGYGIQLSGGVRLGQSVSPAEVHAQSDAAAQKKAAELAAGDALVRRTENAGVVIPRCSIDEGTGDAFIRAYAAIEEGRHDETIAALTSAIEARPGHAAAHLMRARARHELGDRAGALEDLLRSVDLAPNDVSVAVSALLLFLEMGEKVDVDSLDPVVRDEAVFYLCCAAWNALEAGEYTEAVRSASLVLTLDADNAEARSCLAVARFSLGEIDKAAKDVDPVIAINPELRALRGLIRIRLGDRKGALEDARTSGRDFGNNASVIFWNATTLIYAGCLTEAERACTRLLELAPFEPDAVNFRAFLNHVHALGPKQGAKQLEHLRRVPIPIGDSYARGLGAMQRLDFLGAAAAYKDCLEKTRAAGTHESIDALYLEDRCLLGLASALSSAATMYRKFDAAKSEEYTTESMAHVEEILRRHPDWCSGYLAKALFGMEGGTSVEEMADLYEKAVQKQESVDPLLQDMAVSLGTRQITPFLGLLIGYKMALLQDERCMEQYRRVLPLLGKGVSADLIGTIVNLSAQSPYGAMPLLRREHQRLPEKLDSDPVTLLSVSIYYQLLLHLESKFGKEAYLRDQALKYARITNVQGLTWGELTRLAAFRADILSMLASYVERAFNADARIEQIRSEDLDAETAIHRVREVREAWKKEVWDKSSAYVAAFMDEHLSKKEDEILEEVLGTSAPVREPETVMFAAQIEAAETEVERRTISFLLDTFETSLRTVEARGMEVPEKARESIMEARRKMAKRRLPSKTLDWTGWEETRKESPPTEETEERSWTTKMTPFLAAAGVLLLVLFAVVVVRSRSRRAV